MRAACFVLLLLLPFNLLSATLDTYPFKQPANSQRFYRLLKQLRCLVCQNQDLADSNAGLAKDLKNIVYQRVNAGQSDRQILDFLSQTYGDFILFKPPLKASTWLLWFTPLLALLLALIILFKIIYQRANHA